MALAPLLRFPFLRDRKVHRMRDKKAKTIHRSLVAVVDDDESVRESLPDLLREFGFAVQVFSSPNGGWVGNFNRFWAESAGRTAIGDRRESTEPGAVPCGDWPGAG